MSQFVRFKTQISATRGENKIFYLVCLEIDFFHSKVSDWRMRNLICSTQFPGGIQDKVFIFATGGSTYHILAFGRKGIGLVFT